MPEPKHVIPICSYCEKEFPTVETTVRATMKKYGMNGEISFSHGYCLRHYEIMMREYGYTEEQVKAALSKARSQVTADLRERPDLVNLWSKGIFTQEQLQAVQQNQQQVNESLITRFRALAGIRG